MDNDKKQIPENTGYLHEGRDKEGKFLKGFSGNPNGKPKGAKHFTTLVIEALKKVATTDKGGMIIVEKAIAETVVKLALKGDIAMIKLIWNYLDGMPSQDLNMRLGNIDEQWEKNMKTLRKLTNAKTMDKDLLQK